MIQHGVERKLAAILSADVKEYSRLMSQDERSTIRTLTAYKEAMSSLIEEYRGRVVDSPGDNLLAEFGSVIDAVNCAVEIQRELAERNADLPPACQMEFRIGINLGDVVEEEGRLFGDGVNIAARLESLAEAGGICISGTAYDHVKNKLGLEYEYLGKQEVKNIPEPVRVYRVLSFPGAAAHRVVQAKNAFSKIWRSLSMVVAAVFIVGAAVVLWHFYFRPPPIEITSVEKKPSPLAEQPSIAVLPFANMSNDPEQEYFCDGIADQIITSISKIPYITVIARNSSFAYKGQSVNVQQIAKGLGVRYILEGSLQRDNENVRINTQLIDAQTGQHLWAENYDRKLDDIFLVQDEICKNIMVALQVKLTVGEVARLTADTVSIKAYEKYLKAAQHGSRRNMEDSLVTRRLAQEAIALDPEYAAAYLQVGWTYLDEVWFGMTKKPSESIAKAEEMAQKAISIRGLTDGENALLSCVYLLRKDLDKAIAYAEKAVEQRPNFAYVHHILGMALRSNGQYDEAILRFQKALQLNPVKPLVYLNNLAWAYFHSRQCDKAISIWNEVLARNPDYLFAYMGLTAAYWLTGSEDEARQAAQHVLRINPEFSVGYWEKRSYVKDEALMEEQFDAWRKAGLK
jgi:adenylate cyclase